MCDQGACEVSGTLTLSERVLFDELSADGDVFEEALSGVGAALLHRVLGTQGKHRQVLEGKHQFDKSQVKLLSKDLTNLVALILHTEQETVEWVKNMFTGCW